MSDDETVQLENLIDDVFCSLNDEFPSYSFSIHYIPYREFVRWEVHGFCRHSNSRAFGGGKTPAQAKHDIAIDLRAKASIE